MQSPANRTTCLQLAVAALALLSGACTTASEPDDVDRLAVVFTNDDGLELAVGSYDAESGELLFVPEAQDDMREQLAAAGYSASVDFDGEAAEVDFAAGVAFVAMDLEDGDALDLRVTRTGSRTRTIGRLELHEGDAFRLYTPGNKLSTDKWTGSGAE